MVKIYAYFNPARRKPFVMRSAPPCFYYQRLGKRMPWNSARADVSILGWLLLRFSSSASWVPAHGSAWTEGGHGTAPAQTKENLRQYSRHLLLGIPSSHLLLLWSSLLAPAPGLNEEAAQRLSKQRKAHSRIQDFLLLRSSSSVPFRALPSPRSFQHASHYSSGRYVCMQVGEKRSLNCSALQKASLLK